MLNIIISLCHKAENFFDIDMGSSDTENMISGNTVWFIENIMLARNPAWFTEWFIKKTLKISVNHGGFPDIIMFSKNHAVFL